MTSASRVRGRSLVYVLLALGVILPAVVQAQGPSDDFLKGTQLFEERSWSQAARSFEKVTKADAENEPAWYYLGLCRLFDGDTEEALAALQTAATLEPGRAGTYLYIGNIYEAQGAPEQAVVAYQEDLRNRRHRNLAEVYNALGRAYFYAGYFLDALASLDECLRYDPNYLEAIHHRGLTHYYMGEYPKSLKDFKRGVEVVNEWDQLNGRLERFFEKEETSPLSPREERQKQESQETLAQDYDRATEFLVGKAMRRELYVARGDAFDANEQWGEARNSYRDALDLRKALNPADPLPHTRIGLALLHEGESIFYDKGLLHTSIRNADAAVVKLEEAIGYSEDFAPAHAALGDVYLFQASTYVSDSERAILSHSYEDALAEFDKALEADPALIRARLNRARTYLQLGEAGKAIEDLQEALNLDPRNANLYAVAATAYQLAQDYETAISTAATALLLDGDSVEAHNAAGLSYYYLGELGMAAEHFTKAIDADPTKHQSYTNLGNTYFQMESWHRARQQYEKALDIIPDSTVANTSFQRSYLLYLVARTHHFTGQFDKEIEVLNQALTLDPSYLEALLQLAQAYMEIDNYRAAETDLRLALNKSPGEEMDAVIHTFLGRLFEKEGRVHDAITHYGSALKAAQSASIANPEAEEALRRLKAG